ncbi:DNA methyltransferase [Hungatella hathewayi]|uniref:DNA methyltransferase n=1 Tax=Hungatella hathewayi TaxID=154046 RepID=UPI003565E6A4
METVSPKFMSGTAKMLPTEFNHQYVPRKERIHQAEIPVTLIENILNYVTVENELVLDQFAGSGSVGVAALNKGRNCILKEIAKENIDKIVERFKTLGYDNQVVSII